MRARVRGDCGGRRHWHEDRHAVAGLDAEPDERLGKSRHLRRELGDVPFAPVAVLAAEDGGKRVRRAPRPVVDARARDVESPADEPFRPFGAVRRVEHALPGLRELDAEVVDDRGPEPLRLVDRAAVQLVVIRTAEPARQARHVRLLDELSTG